MSLSLPAVDAREMKQIAKKRGYASVSSYVKYLFQTDKDSISEAELLKNVCEARNEYRAGKSIKAKSLADLI